MEWQVQQEHYRWVRFQGCVDQIFDRWSDSLILMGEDVRNIIAVNDKGAIIQ